jgi:uncharacterized MAPEG superfamily protein
MKTELTYLVYVCLLTGLMWLPYILDRIVKWGLPDAVGYPAHPKPVSAWAVRLKAAHANAVENLVVFAPLVLVANVVGVTGSATATAAIVYFWARLVHAIAFTLGIPWVRTLAFTAGMVCYVTMATKILGY